MIALLYKLIVGSLHRHRWECKNEGHIVDNENVPIANYYDCECQKCGEWKRFRLD